LQVYEVQQQQLANQYSLMHLTQKYEQLGTTDA
jgi:hypothetical protein